MKQVILTSDEVEVANLIGQSRHSHCEENNFRDYKKSTKHASNELDTIGVLGEMSVAKYFNCLDQYIDDSCNDIGWTLKDVGKVQVRATPVIRGCLIIRPGDGRGMDGEKLKEPFILVIQYDQFKYGLAGWIFGKDGLKDKWKRNPYNKGEAYFVPQDALRPIETLDKSFFA